MPVYEYYCSACKRRFEMRRPMDQSEADAPCPQCGTPAPKAFSVFTTTGFRDTTFDRASYLASGYDH